MKTFFFILLMIVMFAAGVLASPKIVAANFAQLDLRSLSKAIDFWANRYQTFLGVMVAIVVAYLTVAAMGKQNSISERQFLSGQLQGLLSDRGNLRFVVSQLNEAKMQRVLFENNIAFLETEGDKTSGWQNGGNLIRTAYVNVENFRSLVSANTAKFMGPTGTRTELIAKLNAIVETQEDVRATFLAWANLNRNASAALDAPETPQKASYLQTERKVLSLFDSLLPLAAKAAVELGKKSDQIEKDIDATQKSIDAKSD